MDQNEIFLFNEGRLLEAYRSLGAHVTDGGVTFRVWAPGARNVYVTGDFNGWGKSLPLTPRFYAGRKKHGKGRGGYPERGQFCRK